MSKKDFIALADAIRATRDDSDPAYLDQWNNDVKALANFCQSRNPNFKRQRWLDYIAGQCGKNGGKQ